ncbi:MAG: PEP-CTERM sorting domain-containing protein [Aquabacterium sp.]
MRHLRTACLPVLTALACLPSLGHAAFSLTNVSIACSDTLTVQEGSALSYACTGNLSLTGTDTGASIFADDSITLSAIGDLSVHDLTLMSHNVSLITQSGSISLDGNVTLTDTSGQVSLIPVVQPAAGGLRLIGTPEAPRITDPGTVILANTGNVVISPGGSIELTGAVPEPATSAMLVVGLAILLGAGARRQSR